MVKQVVFLIVLLITLGVFTFSIQRYFRYFKFTKKKPLGQLWTRLWKTRSEEHTSELQSHSFISYAVFCLKKKKKTNT